MISATSSMPASDRSEAVHQVVERIGQRGLHVPGQVCVNLGRAQAAVAEDLLNDPQIDPGFQQVGRVRMTPMFPAT